jgi:3-mercaptopyruvate sulfurtransferase SseA
VVVQALGLCALGVVLGLCVNAVRGGGLPLVTAPFDYQLACEEKMADARGNTVTAEQLAQLLKDPQRAVLDIRSAEVYAAGHIPGARHVAVSVVSATPPALLKPLAGLAGVVVYDDGAELGRAEEFAGELEAAKVGNVRFLDVGYAGWVAAGREVKTGGEP